MILKKDIEKIKNKNQKLKKPSEVSNLKEIIIEVLKLILTIVDESTH